MLDPVITSIEVACGQEKAFNVFVHDMPTWWPLEQRSMSLMNGGSPAKSLRVDARVGGQIVETGHDDTEYLWGTITSFDPHDFLSLGFHMGMPAENASLVEVRFTPLGSERTRVELTQSNWEAFGDMAEMMRGGYGSSWGLILEPYISSCSG